MEQEIIDRVAKNVDCGVDELRLKHDEVKAAQNSVLLAAGKSQEDADLMTLRIAAQQIRVQKNKLARSGCVEYEGMFITCPRYKDWGKMTYDKLSKQLNLLESEARVSLVTQGAIVLFEPDVINGGFLKHHNPSLAAKLPFEEGHASANVTQLPEIAVGLDDGSSFYAIANKTMPTFANGNDNFRYGKARAREELERTSLFLGRVRGSGKDPSLLTVKTSADLAKTQFPTFEPCTISLRAAANGETAYGKAGVSEYRENRSVASIFSEPPLLLEGGGVLRGLLGDKWLSGLDDLENYYNSLDERERWTSICGMALEVCHIDPREKGGYIVTVGDLDLSSLAAPIDIFVPAEHESKVDFGVGSVLAVVGSAWKSRDDEYRFGVDGWWCADSIEAPADLDEEDETGWDE